MLFRAILDALDDWASNGVLPPASQIPKRLDGTLVTYQEWNQQFPKIEGINIPNQINELSYFNFSSEASSHILDVIPPKLQKRNAYTVLVPAVNDDGNEIAGVKVPMITAPLATYTGWNLRSKNYGENYMFLFNGSTIPFPETKNDRLMSNDPRSSILERYPDSKAYCKEIIQAAKILVEQRLILEEDLERIKNDANDWDRLRSGVTLN